VPRDVTIWQRTEADEGYEVCPHCKGWGGHDKTICYGFGADEDWERCITCSGTGQLDNNFAQFLRDRL
jgi:DnaJ-class molecular chaperone